MEPHDPGPSRLHALVAPLIKDPIRSMINPGIERTSPWREEVEAALVRVEVEKVLGMDEVELRSCGDLRYENNQVLFCDFFSFFWKT